MSRLHVGILALLVAASVHAQYWRVGLSSGPAWNGRFVGNGYSDGTAPATGELFSLSLLRSWRPDSVVHGLLRGGVDRTEWWERINKAKSNGSQGAWANSWVMSARGNAHVRFVHVWLGYGVQVPVLSRIYLRAGLSAGVLTSVRYEADYVQVIGHNGSVSNPGGSSESTVDSLSTEIDPFNMARFTLDLGCAVRLLPRLNLDISFMAQLNSLNSYFHAEAPKARYVKAGLEFVLWRKRPSITLVWNGAEAPEG